LVIQKIEKIISEELLQQSQKIQMSRKKPPNNHGKISLKQTEYKITNDSEQSFPNNSCVLDQQTPPVQHNRKIYT
jgi:hypothetical protein